MPHELFLTRGQTTNIINAFANNMSRDIKLTKAQLSKMIQSGGFLRTLGKKVIADLAILLSRDNSPGLVRNLASNEIYKFKRKIKGAVRAGKRFTLFISNEDMNHIIKIIKSL